MSKPSRPVEVESVYKYDMVAFARELRERVAETAWVATMQGGVVAYPDEARKLLTLIKDNLGLLEHVADL